MKKYALIICLFFIVNSSSYAAWVSQTIYGKYKPIGNGWETIGEISEITDADTNKLIGYHFYRKTRSYFIFPNDGQPYFEAWDFPSVCMPDGCKDSRMARVTFIPYNGQKFLGEIKINLNEAEGKFQFEVNNNYLLELDLETMNPVGGIIEENSSIEPKEWENPAIQCSKINITCVRSLAYGRLAHQNISSDFTSLIQWRDGSLQEVPNSLLYNPGLAHSGFLYSSETDLFKATH